MSFWQKQRENQQEFIPPNHLKRYVIRNPDIPSSGNTSESEYGSESENEAEEASSTNDDAAEIPAHTPMDSDDTLPDLTVDELPVPPHVHTPSVSSMPPHVRTPSDEPPMPLHVHTPSDESPTPLHVCTPSKLFPGHTPSSSIPPICSDETMTAAHILAELADGGVEPEPETEEQVVFEDQTLEETDIDILVSGVQRPSAVKFKPLSLFCRKPAGARLGVHVGNRKGSKGIVA